MIESRWSAARKGGSLEKYVKDNMDALDIEALQEVAENAEAPLEQQFKAIAMMCMLEYCRGIEDDVYQYAELWGISDYLSSTRLELGESRDGELAFEVPDALLNGGNPLYIVAICGYQVVFFPI